jgi:hypothetical protein
MSKLRFELIFLLSDDKLASSSMSGQAVEKPMDTASIADTPCDTNNVGSTSLIVLSKV